MPRHSKSTFQKTEVNVPGTNTLPKKERLCSKKDIERLLAKGRHGSSGMLRYIFLPCNGEEYCRILISVPKKLFKRAVKRNLLKRRIRECWRRLKHGVRASEGMDILFIYSTKEILTYQEIYLMMEKAIQRLNETVDRQDN